MVLAILWLSALGTLAVKTKMKDDDGFVKKDNKIYKLAITFFFVSMFFALLFFHLGDHLNGLKKSKNKLAMLYGFSTLFLGVIPLFVESAAIHDLYHISNADMESICTVATYTNASLPDNLDTKYNNMIVRFSKKYDG